MYLLVKIWVRTALQLYCGSIDFDKRHMYTGDKPLILACSHPNSFFDALIMGAYHPRRLHFLARGDAFKNARAARILRMLNMIPIYRMSEGKENLDNNRETFDECVRVFKKGGAVLIFSEGVCVNEWNLRPLKKGTARLAYMCWQQFGIADMVVQPIGINYNSFKQLPKIVHVEYGGLVDSSGFTTDNAATFYKDFNTVLTEKLEPLVLPVHDRRIQKKQGNAVLKTLLAIPALLGWVIHKPPFLLWRRFIRGKTKNTVFYDSVLFASMLLLYPIVVLGITLTAIAVSGNMLYTLLFVLMPFTAWSYTKFKAA